MRNVFTIGLSVALVGSTYAHAQPAATIGDVVVVGAPELLANYLKVTLSTQVGDALSTVNPIAVEQETIATGFFRSARAELRTVNGTNVLHITVVPNPQIASVNVTGASFVPADQVVSFLENNLNIAPETTLNTERIEDSKEQLQQAYRQAGFPFPPGVSTDIRTTDKGAVVTYTISETAPVARVEVTGATQLPADVISGAFRPLVENKSFTLPLYQQAVQAIANAYEQKGLRGSGVNVRASDLQSGVLKVVIAELAVANVDTSTLGNVNVPLQTRPGTLLNSNALTQDVRTLSNATGRPVVFNLQQDPSNPASVSVAFSTAETQTGPIREVRIANATAVPVGDIAKVLNVRIGDTFSPLLAQEDYLAIQRLYQSRGFEVLTTPDPISFENGVLTYTVREARLAGYEIRWEGPHRTQERVILRELPEPGRVLNATELQRSIANNIRQLGFVVPVALQTRADPQNPQNITVVLTLREESSNTFVPAIAYDSINGWSGELGLQGNNLFGLGYGYNVNVTGSPNDVGEAISASASFTIPWLDFNFLDFRNKRTSLSVSTYSNVTGNNALVDPATKTPQGREYTQRSTGVQVGVTRAITPNLSAGVSVSTQYNYSRLEPFKGDEPGTVTSPATGTKEPAVSEARAQELTPQAGLTTLVGANVGFSNVTRPDFPTSGFRVNASAAYGFGYEGSTGLSWTQYETGGRSYFGFGRTLGDGNQQQAVAVRLNAGTIIGTAPATRLFNVGGTDPADRFTLRGFEAFSNIGKNYFTTSAEYRYNFNVNNSFAQGIYGVVFVDVGDAWTDGSDFALNLGYGAGVQLNLGLGNFQLPALRFDYAFSQQNPGGKFYFRIGTFF